MRVAEILMRTRAAAVAHSLAHPTTAMRGHARPRAKSLERWVHLGALVIVETVHLFETGHQTRSSPQFLFLVDLHVIFAPCVMSMLGEGSKRLRYLIGGGDELDEFTPANIDSIIMLQRRLRTKWHMYRNFGPDIFVNSQKQAFSGRLTFERGPATPAQWILMSKYAQVGQVEMFMNHHWRLPRPELVLAIAGSVTDFPMSPQLTMILGRGLASAAKAAKAWIFTSGTDTGVTKLVGDAAERYKIDAPMIGICPWEAVSNQEQLVAANHNIGLYTPAADGLSNLNPSHTHFLFVQTGQPPEEAWGREMLLRAALEKHVAEVRRVPVVMGEARGARTRATALRHLKPREPATRRRSYCSTCDSCGRRRSRGASEPCRVRVSGAASGRNLRFGRR